MVIVTKSRSSGKHMNFIRNLLVLFSLILLSLNAMAQTEAWVKKTQLPTQRAASSAEVIEGKIYVIGGTSGPPSNMDVAANEVYDPVSNKWATKNPMPTPRGFLATAVINDTIYAMGGAYPGNPGDALEAYDPATDTWVKKADMLMSNAEIQAGVVNGKIYVMGGAYGKRNCQEYDPGTNKWTEKTERPVTGGVMAVTVYNGLVYTFGGSLSPNGPVNSSVYAYNPQTDIWLKKKDMPTARFSFHTYLVNNKIYAIGGSQGSPGTLATVEVYDPVTDTWEKRPDMPVKLAYFAGAVVNNKIYVIGGTPDWATGGLDIWEYNPEMPIELSPASIHFNSTLTELSSDTAYVTIRNKSPQSINIGSISLNIQSFSLSDLPAFPAAIGPSDSLRFGVFFQPKNRGSVNGIVKITTDNAQYPALTIPLLGTGLECGSQFRKFVNRVISVVPQERPAIIDSFLSKNPAMPFIEQDSICQFMYRGNASGVCLAGDANFWNKDGNPMSRLSETNLWYSTEIFEPDARLEYKFVIDGNNWILDPMNPKKWTGGLGSNSVLSMPAYVEAPEMKYIKEIPHGTLFDTTFGSKILGNIRGISIYTPPGYALNVKDSFKVVLFHDGIEWINLAFAVNTLDYLIDNLRIQPVIAVFVAPVMRDPEYIGDLQDQYAKFITTELMPYVDKHFRTRINPQCRATAGISNGGNIALVIQNYYPQMFGNAASFSGTILPSTRSSFQNTDPKSTKLYIDVGTYDLLGFYDLTNNFRKIIAAKGYNHRYNEWHEGHSWGSWGAHLDNALEYFFPGSAVYVREENNVPAAYSLLQNYPNPFNAGTVIKYTLAVTGKVQLKVFDILGREIAILVNEEKPAGSYEVKFNGSGFASGFYVYQLKAGSFLSAKKMLMIK